MNTKTKSRKGFSLPELITVVVVVAILGAIAIGVVSNLSTEAQRSAANASVQSANRMIGNIRGAAISGTGLTAINGAENQVLWALNRGINITVATGAAVVSGAGPIAGQIRFVMNPPLPGVTPTSDTFPATGAAVTGNRMTVSGGVVTYSATDI